ncbi:dermonecrotic toxin domain-containing protein [Pseudomonas sp. FP2338]|uniref:dermonecrotic toxin domain-containing protein n=1 Tax=Pseudomonas sp. FP2338 TaxID=2954093 RepID=UPI002736DD24|nr:DUF6543 domain-containing protein [Pseudomonas sp. FP2338]WLH85945.1 hypothetical protein PSH96_05735 [Pseudomonas sp. FP2338]
MHISLPASQEPRVDDPQSLQADSATSIALQPVTLPVAPPASLTSDQQQAHLISELNKLKSLVDELIQQQPSPGSLYQQQLAAIFPEVHRPIDPNQIFYSRYRENTEGHKQLLSCEPLGSLLKALRAPGAEAYLAQEAGAFYRECNTLDADKRLSPIVSPATLAAVLEIAITVGLNTFWESAQGDQPNPEAQLVSLRRKVLAHQLALHAMDGTLSAQARTLADNVLKYPSAVMREQIFTADNRPTVYRLALEDGSEFAGVFILSPTGGTPLRGSVMLYSPSEAFEEYESLARLNETVAARIREGGTPANLLIASLPMAARAALSGSPVLTANPIRIDADVIADSVRSLRVRQHFSVREALRRETLPSTGELDLAADLTPQLDVADAFVTRNQRLLATEPTWLKNTDAQDQARYRQLEKELVDSHEVLKPLLEKILTLEAFSQRETDKVLKTLHPAYANVEIAPYRSLVRLRISTSARSAEVTGYRDEETATVYISEDHKINVPQFIAHKKLTSGTWRTQAVVDLRTLASYTQRNVDPWSVHGIHTIISATANIIDTAGKQHGKLSNDDLRTLAQTANIGQAYDAYLKAAFAPNGEGSTFAAAWQRAHAAQMNNDALESRLNPDAAKLFTFQTPGSGFDWIKAITEHPDSTSRPLVNNFEIEVNLLVLGAAQARGQGGQVIHRVLVIHRKGTKPDGVSVLYTPDAPDGFAFRELINGLVELDTLKAKPEWQAYFTQYMATKDKKEVTRIFNDTHGVHRYALTPVTGNLHAYLYSAQLGFQLAHADYRSRSNAQIALESAANRFMFGFEVFDFLLGLIPGKTTLSLLRLGLIRRSGLARQLGHPIPGVVRKVTAGQKTKITLSGASIRPLEPAWLDVVPYRLPNRIDPLFDVDAFARKNHYTVSRPSASAPHFFDKHNNQLVAMRDEVGGYHLYQSYVKDGARYVKDPAGKHMDFLVVPGNEKSWRPRFERQAMGGGSALGTLRSLTPDQQVDADLIAALRLFTTEGEIRDFMRVIEQTGASQKLDLITRTRQQLGTLDEAEFRRWLANPRSLSRARQERLRHSMLNLRFELATLEHIHLSTQHFAQPLSVLEKEELFKKVKRLIGKNDNFDKQIRTSIAIVDPDTKAQFVGYAITNKHQTALNKFSAKHELSTWRDAALVEFANDPERLARIHELASNLGITRQEAVSRFLLLPDTQETLEAFLRDTVKAKLARLQVASFSEDFKKSGIPYIALSRGQPGAGAGVAMVDSRDVAAFENALPKFSTPLEFEVPRVQTQRVERPGPTLPVVPQVLPTRDPHINIVKLDDLAQTQKKLLPAPATAKLEEITQDIQAGRLSRKRIGNYTYVDLPQVQPGSGRGLWRVAIEQNGKEGGKDVYIIRGIFDYHASKHVAWGV